MEMKLSNRKGCALDSFIYTHAITFVLIIFHLKVSGHLGSSSSRCYLRDDRRGRSWEPCKCLALKIEVLVPLPSSWAVYTFSFRIFS